MRERELILYAREACHLCERLEAALDPWLERHGLEVRWVDVDSDPELAWRFGERVPVLVLDGREVCHYFLDEEALAEALERAR